MAIERLSIFLPHSGIGLKQREPGTVPFHHVNAWDLVDGINVDFSGPLVAFSHSLTKRERVERCRAKIVTMANHNLGVGDHPIIATNAQADFPNRIFNMQHLDS